MKYPVFYSSSTGNTAQKSKSFLERQRRKGFRKQQGCEVQRNLWKTSISQESRLYLCRMVHQPHRRQQSSRQYQGYEEKEPYPVCPLEKDCRWKCSDWKTDECQRKETEGADQEHQGCEEIPGIPCRGCQVQQGQEDRYLWKIHRNDYQTEKRNHLLCESQRIL